mmetsp:Transcript_18592/g.51686  ORF Transcript_18592/g.51686 Transcript_18592/m.51686 type:complete len:84 (-) Transcript_18592:7-258(-)
MHPELLFAFSLQCNAMQCLTSRNRTETNVDRQRMFAGSMTSPCCLFQIRERERERAIATMPSIITMHAVACPIERAEGGSTRV